MSNVIFGNRSLVVACLILAAGTAWPSEPGELDDLPLVEVRATGTELETLAVILTGDGGWAALDKGLAQFLSEHGIAVVGFNTLKYLWRPRTPDEAGTDLSRVVDHYLKQWDKRRAVLIGYSMGAEMLPFMARRLPAELRGRVPLVALLGPGPTARFEFHISYWFGGGYGGNALPITPELERMRDMRVICFYGDQDADSLCRDLKPELAEAVKLGGGHHFGGEYDDLGTEILKRLDIGGDDRDPVTPVRTSRVGY